MRNFENYFEEKVNCLVFSNNSRILYSGSADQTIKGFDIVEKSLLFTLKNIHNGNSENFLNCQDSITSLCLSHDGSHLLTNSMDGSCGLIHLESNQVVHKFAENQGSYKYAALSSDSSRIFLATSDFSIEMLDFNSHKIIHTFKNVHENQITAIAVSPNNSYFVSVSRDKSLKIFDIELKKMIRSYPNLSEEWITSLSISSDSHYIVCGSLDQSIKVLSMGIPYDEDTYCDISDEEIIATALCNDKYLLFLGSKNGMLTVLDYETKEILMSTPYHEGAINSLCISKCGSFVVSGSADRSVKVMAIENYKELYHFVRAHEEPVLAVETSYNSRYVISGCAEGSIRVIELVHNKEIHNFNAVHNGPIACIRSFHKSSKFASSSHDGSIKLFDLSDMCEIHHFRHVHNDKINSIALSSDDTILLSASSDLSVKMLDLETKQLIKSFIDIHEKPILCLNISTDLEFFITGSADGSSKVFDLDTMKEIHQYDLFSKRITSIAISKDNTTAIYTSSDHSVKYLYISHLLNSVSCSFGEKKLDSYSLYGLFKLDLLFQALSKSLNIRNILYANRAIYVNPYGWNLLHLLSISYPKLISAVSYEDLKVPFKVDSYGRTPIHYTFAHANVDYSIANLQMKYLVEYLEDSRDTLSQFEFNNLMKVLSPIAFPLFFYRIDPSISNRFLPFLDKVPMTPNLQEVPRFGSVKGKNSFAFQPNDTPVLNEHIKESILDENDYQAVNIRSLMLSLDYNLWSEDMLNSVVTMMQMPNEEFFQSKAVTVLIEYLWRRVKLFHEVLAAIFSVLMLLLSVYLGLPERDTALETTILVLSIFFLGYEILQLALSGLEAYFSDVWNWIDILYYITLCSTISLRSLLDDNVTRNWLFSFCLLLGYVRWTSFLRIFDQTRNLIRIILVVIKDMRSFILILLLAVFGFSLVFYGFNRDVSYSSHLFLVYNLLYGNMPQDDLTPSEVELTVLITFIVNIILLNLLIATMGGTYDRVYKMRVLNDSKEKLEMILETILAIRCWHRIRAGKGTQKSKRQFLIYAEACKEYRGEENSKKAEESIIKALERQIEEMKANQAKFEQKIENSILSLEKKLENQENKFEKSLEKCFEAFQASLLSNIAQKKPEKLQFQSRV